MRQIFRRPETVPRRKWERKLGWCGVGFGCWWCLGLVVGGVWVGVGVWGVGCGVLVVGVWVGVGLFGEWGSGRVGRETWCKLEPHA